MRQIPPVLICIAPDVMESKWSTASVQSIYAYERRTRFHHAVLDPRHHTFGVINHASTIAPTTLKPSFYPSRHAQLSFREWLSSRSQIKQSQSSLMRPSTKPRSQVKVKQAKPDEIQLA